MAVKPIIPTYHGPTNTLTMISNILVGHIIDQAHIQWHSFECSNICTKDPNMPNKKPSQTVFTWVFAAASLNLTFCFCSSHNSVTFYICITLIRHNYNRPGSRPIHPCRRLFTLIPNTALVNLKLDNKNSYHLYN